MSRVADQHGHGDTILDRLLLSFGSVLPYREICSLNLLVESQGEKKRQSPWQMRGPVWGVRRRLVSVIPSRSARKGYPTPGAFVSQPPSPYHIAKEGIEESSCYYKYV